MTEQTPWARLAARNEWQGGNDGGVRMSTTPPRSMIETWATKMDPAVFKWNGDIRRAYRTTYGERFAQDGTILLGVLAFCAIVWAAVWGVMA